jgi:hypothetical protein
VLIKKLKGQFSCITKLEEDQINRVEPLKAKRDSYNTLKLARLSNNIL